MFLKPSHEIRKGAVSQILVIGTLVFERNDIITVSLSLFLNETRVTLQLPVTMAFTNNGRMSVASFASLSESL